MGDREEKRSGLKSAHHSAAAAAAAAAASGAGAGAGSTFGHARPMSPPSTSRVSWGDGEVNDNNASGSDIQSGGEEDDTSERRDSISPPPDRRHSLSSSYQPAQRLNSYTPTQPYAHATSSGGGNNPFATPSPNAHKPHIRPASGGHSHSHTRNMSLGMAYLQTQSPQPPSASPSASTSAVSSPHGAAAGPKSSAPYLLQQQSAYRRTASLPNTDPASGTAAIMTNPVTSSTASLSSLASSSAASSSASSSAPTTQAWGYNSATQYPYPLPPSASTGGGGSGNQSQSTISGSQHQSSNSSALSSRRRPASANPSSHSHSFKPPAPLSDAYFGDAKPSTGGFSGGSGSRPGNSGGLASPSTPDSKYSTAFGGSDHSPERPQSRTQRLSSSHDLLSNFGVRTTPNQPTNQSGAPNSESPAAATSARRSSYDGGVSERSAARRRNINLLPAPPQSAAPTAAGASYNRMMHTNPSVDAEEDEPTHDIDTRADDEMEEIDTAAVAAAARNGSLNARYGGYGGTELEADLHSIPMHPAHINDYSRSASRAALEDARRNINTRDSFGRPLSALSAERIARSQSVERPYTPRRLWMYLEDFRLRQLPNEAMAIVSANGTHHSHAQQQPAYGPAPPQPAMSRSVSAMDHHPPNQPRNSRPQSSMDHPHRPVIIAHNSPSGNGQMLRPPSSVAPSPRTMRVVMAAAAAGVANALALVAPDAQAAVAVAITGPARGGGNGSGGRDGYGSSQFAPTADSRAALANRTSSRAGSRLGVHKRVPLIATGVSMGIGMSGAWSGSPNGVVDIIRPVNDHAKKGKKSRPSSAAGKGSGSGNGNRSGSGQRNTNSRPSTRQQMQPNGDGSFGGGGGGGWGDDSNWNGTDYITDDNFLHVPGDEFDGEWGSNVPGGGGSGRRGQSSTSDSPDAADGRNSRSGGRNSRNGNKRRYNADGTLSSSNSTASGLNGSGHHSHHTPIDDLVARMVQSVDLGTNKKNSKGERNYDATSRMLDFHISLADAEAIVQRFHGRGVDITIKPIESVVAPGYGVSVTGLSSFDGNNERIIDLLARITKKGRTAIAEQLATLPAAVFNGLYRAQAEELVERLADFGVKSKVLKLPATHKPVVGPLHSQILAKKSELSALHASALESKRALDAGDMQLNRLENSLARSDRAAADANRDIQAMTHDLSAVTNELDQQTGKNEQFKTDEAAVRALEIDRDEKERALKLKLFELKANDLGSSLQRSGAGASLLDAERAAAAAAAQAEYDRSQRAAAAAAAEAEANRLKLEAEIADLNRAAGSAATELSRLAELTAQQTAAAAAARAAAATAAAEQQSQRDRLAQLNAAAASAAAASAAAAAAPQSVDPSLVAQLTTAQTVYRDADTKLNAKTDELTAANGSLATLKASAAASNAAAANAAAAVEADRNAATTAAAAVTALQSQIDGLTAQHSTASAELKALIDSTPKYSEAATRYNAEVAKLNGQERALRAALASLGPAGGAGASVDADGLTVDDDRDTITEQLIMIDDKLNALRATPDAKVAAEELAAAVAAAGAAATATATAAGGGATAGVPSAASLVSLDPSVRAARIQALTADQQSLNDRLTSGRQQLDAATLKSQTAAAALAASTAAAAAAAAASSADPQSAANAAALTAAQSNVSRLETEVAAARAEHATAKSELDRLTTAVKAASDVATANAAAASTAASAATTAAEAAKLAAAQLAATSASSASTADPLSSASAGAGPGAAANATSTPTATATGALNANTAIAGGVPGSGSVTTPRGTTAIPAGLNSSAAAAAAAAALAQLESQRQLRSADQRNAEAALAAKQAELRAVQQQQQQLQLQREQLAKSAPKSDAANGSGSAIASAASIAQTKADVSALERTIAAVNSELDRARAVAEQNLLAALQQQQNQSLQSQQQLNGSPSNAGRGRSGSGEQSSAVQPLDPNAVERVLQLVSDKRAIEAQLRRRNSELKQITDQQSATAAEAKLVSAELTERENEIATFHKKLAAVTATLQSLSASDREQIALGAGVPAGGSATAAGGAGTEPAKSYSVHLSNYNPADKAGVVRTLVDLFGKKHPDTLYDNAQLAVRFELSALQKKQSDNDRLAEEHRNRMAAEQNALDAADRQRRMNEARDRLEAERASAEADRARLAEHKRRMEAEQRRAAEERARLEAAQKAADAQRAAEEAARQAELRRQQALITAKEEAVLAALAAERKRIEDERRAMEAAAAEAERLRLAAAADAERARAEKAAREKAALDAERAAAEAEAARRKKELEDENARRKAELEAEADRRARELALEREKRQLELEAERKRLDDERRRLEEEQRQREDDARRRAAEQRKFDDDERALRDEQQRKRDRLRDEEEQRRLELNRARNEELIRAETELARQRAADEKRRADDERARLADERRRLEEERRRLEEERRRAAAEEAERLRKEKLLDDERNKLIEEARRVVLDAKRQAAEAEAERRRLEAEAKAKADAEWRKRLDDEAAEEDAAAARLAEERERLEARLAAERKKKADEDAAAEADALAARKRAQAALDEEERLRAAAEAARRAKEQADADAAAAAAAAAAEAEAKRLADAEAEEKRRLAEEEAAAEQKRRDDEAAALLAEKQRLEVEAAAAAAKARFRPADPGLSTPNTRQEQSPGTKARQLAQKNKEEMKLRAEDEKRKGMASPVSANFTSVAASANTKKLSDWEAAEQLAQQSLHPSQRKSLMAGAGAGAGDTKTAVLTQSPATDSVPRLVSMQTMDEAKQLLGDEDDDDEDAKRHAAASGFPDGEDTAFTLFGVTVKPTMNHTNAENARLELLEYRARTAAEMDDVFRRYLGIERADIGKGITYYCDIGLSCFRLVAMNVLAGDSDPFIEIQRVRGNTAEKVAETETMKGTTNPAFPSILVNLDMLCHSQPERKIGFKVWNENKPTASELRTMIGETQLSLVEIQNTLGQQQPLYRPLTASGSWGPTKTMGYVAFRHADLCVDTTKPTVKYPCINMRDPANPVWTKQTDCTFRAIVSCESLPAMSILRSKGNVYVEFYRLEKDNSWSPAPVYKTEVVADSNKPKFLPIVIPTFAICYGDPKRRILMKVMDAPNVGTATLIGQIELSLKEMIPKKRKPDPTETITPRHASRPSITAAAEKSIVRSTAKSPSSRARSPGADLGSQFGAMSVNQRNAAASLLSPRTSASRATSPDGTGGGLLTMGNALGKDLSALSSREKDDIKEHTRRYALERPGQPKPSPEPKYGIICFYKAKVFSRLAELPLLAMNAGIERRTVKIKSDLVKTGGPRDDKVLLIPLLATIKKGVGIYTVARMASRRIKNSILLAEQRTLLASHQPGRSSMDYGSGSPGQSGGLGTIKGGTFTPPQRSPMASVRGLGSGRGSGRGSGTGPVTAAGTGTLAGTSTGGGVVGLGSLTGLSSTGSNGSGGVSSGTTAGTGTGTAAAGTATMRATASGHHREASSFGSGGSGKLDASSIVGLMKTFSNKTKQSSQVAATAAPAGNTLLDDVMAKWDEHERKANATPGVGPLWKRSTINADGTRTPTRGSSRSPNRASGNYTLSSTTTATPPATAPAAVASPAFTASTAPQTSTGAAGAVSSPSNKRAPLRDMIKRVMKKKQDAAGSPTAAGAAAAASASAPATSTAAATAGVGSVSSPKSATRAIPGTTSSKKRRPLSAASTATTLAVPTTPKRA